MAAAVETGEYERGIAICGSGNGISMTANKHQGIRCALCWNMELAALARQHNNANVVGLPARFIAYEEAQNVVDVFLKRKSKIVNRQIRHISTGISFCASVTAKVVM